MLSGRKSGVGNQNTVPTNAGFRPITEREICKHLREFGIPEELALRKIRWMSGGQLFLLVIYVGILDERAPRAGIRWVSGGQHC